MSDTLAQKYLIELLMWNALNVHKQSSTVWQEKLVDPSWNSVRGMFSTSLLWRRFWCNRTQSKKVQIATTVQKWNENRIDLPVLGLAGCHSENGKLQVRLHDIMDGSSLARAIHVPTGPLHTWQEIVDQNTNKQKEVLHLCRWSTHTHTLRQNQGLFAKTLSLCNQL